MKLKPVIRISLTVCILFLVIFIIINSLTIKQTPKEYSLEMQESIKHCVKFEVKPYFNPEAQEIRFDISVESYEHKEILEDALLDVAILENDQGHTLALTHVEEQNITEYRKEGQIYFNWEDLFNGPLTLHLFGFEQHTFTWDFVANDFALMGR